VWVEGAGEGCGEREVHVQESPLRRGAAREGREWVWRRGGRGAGGGVSIGYSPFSFYYSCVAARPPLYVDTGY
jgi:hypothetical protein